MPATFPSHAAAVLPLKLWRPRRFDGVALVIGSTSPDLLYPLAGLVSWRETHTIDGLFWFCVPVTVLLAWVVRRAAPVAAAHLPVRPRALALRDYGVLGGVRHPVWVTLTSALIGAASHVGWDGFTHPADGHGWAMAYLPALEPWFEVSQHVSSAAGALGALAVAIHIGRRRLLRGWHGPAPRIHRRPRLFWSVAVAASTIYPLTWAILPFRWAAHVQGVRMLWIAGLAILAGVAACRLAERAGWNHDYGASGRVPDRAGHDG
jgi:hypothetical protein